MEEEFRKYLRYLHELEAALTPEEFREVLRDIGTIDDWRERNDVIEEIIFERKAWRSFVRTCLRVLAWFAATIITLGGMKALLPPGAWPW